MTQIQPLQLRPFDIADFPQLNSFVTDASFLLQWAGNSLDYPLTSTSFEQHVQGVLSEPQASFCYSAYTDDESQLVGYGEIRGQCPKQHAVRLCRIVVGPNYRGQRLGQQLVQALVNTAFEQLPVHRVELEVYDFNTAAQRCYGSLGFRHEGVRRQAVKFGDTYWNSCIMGLLRPEWQAQQAALADSQATAVTQSSSPAEAQAITDGRI